ncbi:hypothetical protein [Methylopila sp. M107]|uniref:hypothetical protein n=1 Tax=Methylopila sp. M107 TaxID=1101190 RepID=UPI0003A41A79|nr:hypothetical protein [Methylopila sp. M107]
MADDRTEIAQAPVGAAKWAAKHEATARAAKAIIEKERAERDARTARLKAARLARDAELAAADPA